MNHKYSTFAIAGLILMGIVAVVSSLTSSDVDELCAIDNMTLFRYNGEWLCGDLKNVVWTNVTNNITIYNNYSNYSNNSEYLVGVTGSSFMLKSQWNATNVSYRLNNNNTFYNNFGIGTANPSRSLEIIDNQNAVTGIILNNSNTGSSTRIRLSFYKGTSDMALLQYNTPSNTFQMGTSNGNANPVGFIIGGVTQMQISATGNVGINTIAPNNKLEVNGTLQITRNYTAVTCNIANAGAIYYDNTTYKHYGCNTTTWNALY